MRIKKFKEKKTHFEIWPSAIKPEIKQQTLV